MPRDPKKGHQANAYVDFWEKRGAKSAVGTTFRPMNTGSDMRIIKCWCSGHNVLAFKKDLPKPFAIEFGLQRRP